MSSEKAASTFEEAFAKFSEEDDGKSISLSSIKRWMDKAELIGNDKIITEGELNNAYAKVAGDKKQMDINEFQQMLQKIADDKDMKIESLVAQLAVAKKSVTKPCKDATASIKEAFKQFAQDRDQYSNGTHISLRKILDWMEEAKLIGDKIKLDDVTIAYSKVARYEGRIDITRFLQLLQQLAKDKEMKTESLVEQLASVYTPGKSCLECVKKAIGLE